MPYPSVSKIFTNQGGKECMIGERGRSIAITIEGNRTGTAAVPVTIKGPSLFARRTASPYKAVPLMNNAVIANPTNTTNATVDVPDAMAAKFKVGDSASYYDVSAVGMYTGAALAISAIGAAGSGGAGETLVTFTGTWTTAPVASDLLVVADGAQLSKNAVVVLEDVTLDGVNDVPAAGFIDGAFVKGSVENTTYFVQADNQLLKLVDQQ